MLFKHGLAGLAKVPASGGTATATFIGKSATTATTGTSQNAVFTSISDGDDLIFSVVKDLGPNNISATDLTVDGVSFGSPITTVQQNQITVHYFRGPCPAGRGGVASVPIVLTHSTGQFGWLLMKAENVTTATHFSNNTIGTSTSVSVTRSGSGCIIGTAMSSEADTAITGITEDAFLLDSDRASVGIEDVTGSGSVSVGSSTAASAQHIISCLMLE